MSTTSFALPKHPTTGLTAVGIVNGRPVWPILGAVEDDDSGAGGEGGSDGGEGEGEGSEKEPTAEQKLEALESAAAAAKKVNRDLERKLKANQAELDRLKAESEKKPGDEIDPETIKAEARKEALAEASVKANDRLIRAEVKAAAGTKLADPNDAVHLLDLADFDVDEDGNVDETAIAEAIDELIKHKPYLAAQGGKRFQGSGDGGARNGSGAPDIDAQIAEATKAGDFQRAIALKQQRAALNSQK